VVTDCAFDEALAKIVRRGGRVIFPRNRVCRVVEARAAAIENLDNLHLDVMVCTRQVSIRPLDILAGLASVAVLCLIADDIPADATDRIRPRKSAGRCSETALVGAIKVVNNGRFRLQRPLVGHVAWNKRPIVQAILLHPKAENLAVMLWCHPAPCVPMQAV
jgi:hypothetical protein